MFDIQIKLEGLNAVTRAVVELPGIFAKARRSALSSTGFQIRDDLKQEGRALTPKLNPHTGVLAGTHDTGKRLGSNVRWGKKRRKGTNEWSTGTSRSRGSGGMVAQKTSTRRNPFARFVNMVRYNVDIEDNMVEIGILNPKPIYYVWFRKNVAGFQTAVTARMRKFLFAAGFPIGKGTTSLTTPARPWVVKVRERWQSKGPRVFEEKFWQSLARHKSGSLFKS